MGNWAKQAPYEKKIKTRHFLYKSNWLYTLLGQEKKAVLSAELDMRSRTCIGCYFWLFPYSRNKTTVDIADCAGEICDLLFPYDELNRETRPKCAQQTASKVFTHHSILLFFVHQLELWESLLWWDVQLCIGSSFLSSGLMHPLRLSCCQFRLGFHLPVLFSLLSFCQCFLLSAHSLECFPGGLIQFLRLSFVFRRHRTLWPILLLLLHSLVRTLGSLVLMRFSCLWWLIHHTGS